MVESAGIQVKPSLITSHTQYVHACASDQYTQTDIMTKNKRSQVGRALFSFSFVFAFI